MLFIYYMYSSLEILLLGDLTDSGPQKIYEYSSLEIFLLGADLTDSGPQKFYDSNRSLI